MMAVNEINDKSAAAKWCAIRMLTNLLTKRMKVMHHSKIEKAVKKIFQFAGLHGKNI